MPTKILETISTPYVFVTVNNNNAPVFSNRHMNRTSFVFKKLKTGMAMTEPISHHYKISVTMK